MKISRLRCVEVIIANLAQIRTQIFGKTKMEFSAIPVSLATAGTPIVGRGSHYSEPVEVTNSLFSDPILIVTNTTWLLDAKTQRPPFCQHSSIFQHVGSY